LLILEEYKILTKEVEITPKVRCNKKGADITTELCLRKLITFTLYIYMYIVFFPT
jgi:hypothetical protein